MGYTTDPEMVRVDLFKKESGKWYDTIAIKWTGCYDNSMIHEEFIKSFIDHYADKTIINNKKDFIAVCLHPYHKHKHPLLFKLDWWLEQDFAKNYINERVNK